MKINYIIGVKEHHVCNTTDTKLACTYELLVICFITFVQYECWRMIDGENGECERDFIYLVW